MNPGLHDVEAVLKNTNLMTIATIAADGRPQSAAVEFASTPEHDIIIDCYADSHKSQNLKRDPRTALVIGWDDNITLQIEGTAVELAGAELGRCKEVYFTKNPAAKKWQHEPEVTYYKITSTWIRYSDLNHRPWIVKEFTLS